MASDLRGPTIGEVVTLVRGNTYKSALLGRDGPVLLGLGTIQRNGGFRADSLKTYGGESAEKLLLRPGDLYVSLKDVTQSADLLGAIARLPDAVSRGRLTQDTVKLDFTGTPYPRSLLYWALRAPQYRAFCREHATGTTNLGMAREDFLGYRLPAPRGDTLALVELLEGIEARIELLRRNNTTLESIAQALFKSWFVDFDPVRAKAEGREPEGMDAATAALFPSGFEQSELGLIPQGWQVKKLGDVCRLTWGNTSMTKKSYVDKGVKAFSAAGQDGFVEIGERSGIGSVISAIGTVGVVHLAFGQWTAIKNTLTAQCDTDVGSAWLHHLITTVRFPARGSTQQFISQTDAREVRVVVPASNARQKYGATCVALILRMEALQEQERLLSQLRDTLLPRLISGSLRLTKAEPW